MYYGFFPRNTSRKQYLCLIGLGMDRKCFKILRYLSPFPQYMSKKTGWLPWVIFKKWNGCLIVFFLSTDNDELKGIGKHHFINLMDLKFNKAIILVKSKSVIVWPFFIFRVSILNDCHWCISYYLLCQFLNSNQMHLIWRHNSCTSLIHLVCQMEHSVRLWNKNHPVG